MHYAALRAGAEPTTWWVTLASLTQSGPGEAIDVDLERVTRVQLGVRGSQRVCVVDAGDHTVRVPSHHVEADGALDDRTEAWARWVRFLCARTARQGTRFEVIDRSLLASVGLASRAFDPRDIPVRLCPAAVPEPLPDDWADHFEAASERFEDLEG